MSAKDVDKPIKASKPPKQEEDPSHYVNNKDFYVACRDYSLLYREHKAKGLPGEPPIPDYMARCFIAMCNKMASRYNFFQYTWKDEMIGDGILTCVMGAKSFNPDDPRKNAFGYFSRIIFRAFTRRIKKENKAVKIRLDLCRFFDVELDDDIDSNQNNSDDASEGHSEEQGTETTDIVDN